MGGAEMGIFDVDYIVMLKNALEQAGIRIKTFMPIYVNEVELGGFGIIFGNMFGMILAHILLLLFTICALIGFITIIGGIISRKKKHKMDPHEKWLKTGKM